jgi:hypothetical protein
MVHVILLTTPFLEIAYYVRAWQYNLFGMDSQKGSLLLSLYILAFPAYLLPQAVV